MLSCAINNNLNKGDDIISWIDDEKRRAEEEMLLALKAKPKTNVASKSNSQYNNNTKKSSATSEMRTIGEKQKLASNTLVKAAEKVVKKEEKSTGNLAPIKTDTYASDLPRAKPSTTASTDAKEKKSAVSSLSDTALKLNDNFISVSNGFRDIAKNLPNKDERLFGAAIFGKEAEEKSYNRAIVEEMQKLGSSIGKKTQDQLFREGFYGVEKQQDYAEILQNAMKATRQSIPQSRMDEFKEIQDRNKYHDARKTQFELQNQTPPGMEEHYRQEFIKPAGTTLNARLLKTAEQYLLDETEKTQTKPSTPDAIEFGEDSETYKILQDLSKRWHATSDPAEKDRLHGVAEDVRRLARGKNRVKYGTDEIFEVMHKNAKTGQLVRAGSLGTVPIKTSLMNPFLAGASGALLEPAAFLTTMTDYGPWDYKRKDYWRVGGDEDAKRGEKLKYFDGKDLDVDNNRNWLPWIYFDGYLIGADKFGNMNMAYVGEKMGLPEWVYKNFTTMDDPEDIFWIDKGTNYAKSGR